jgi:hypothetical protein
MGTRAAILEKNGSGYRGIYLHSDGDISHTGRILAKFYGTARKVASLINLGDLSVLGEKINPTLDTHSFGYENAEKGVVVAYHRDRGDSFSDVGPIEGDTIEELADMIDHQYLYVFENGKWSVGGQDLKAALKDLKK